MARMKNGQDAGASGTRSRDYSSLFIPVTDKFNLQLLFASLVLDFEASDWLPVGPVTFLWLYREVGC